MVEELNCNFETTLVTLAASPWPCPGDVLAPRSRLPRGAAEASPNQVSAHNASAVALLVGIHLSARAMWPHAAPGTGVALQYSYNGFTMLSRLSK